jgi:hypothetical protein
MTTQLQKLIWSCVVCGVGWLSTPARAEGQNVLVLPAESGFTLRYQDPDFDNRWEEFYVRVDKHSALIETNVKRRSDGLFEYEYVVTPDAATRLYAWSVQVQYGTEVVLLPEGWHHETKAGVGIMRLSSERGAEPDTALGGFKISSTSLPAPYEAHIEGALPTVDGADLPPFVKAKAKELLAVSAPPITVLRPWILTRSLEEGDRAQALPAAAILEQAVLRYETPLIREQLAGSTHAGDALQAIDLMRDALDDLRASRQSIGAGRLARARKLVAKPSDGDARGSVIPGFRIVIDYVAARLPVRAQ